MGIIQTTSNQTQKQSVSLDMRTLAYRNNSILAAFMTPTPAGTKSNPDIKDPNKHQWVNQRLTQKRGYLNADITAADTTIQVKGNYISFIPGKSIAVINDEVVSISTATQTSYGYDLTVTRGAIGTTAAVASAGTQLKFQDVWLEGENTDKTIENKGEFDWNCTQIFRYDMGITGSAKAAENWDKANDLATQYKQNLGAHFQEIGGALFNPNAPLPNSGSNPVETNKRYAAGMPYYLADSCKINGLGNVLERKTLQADLDMLMRSGVNPQNVLMIAGSDVMATITTWKEHLVRETMGIRGLDFNVQRIVTPNGSIRLADYTLDLNPNEYYIFDKDSVKIKFFRALALEKLAKTGDSERTMAVSEATFEFHNWKKGAAVRRNNIG